MTKDFRVSSRNSVVFVVHCRHATQNGVTTRKQEKQETETRKQETTARKTTTINREK